jgi:glycosyltransferase involved in cell wall biosynthesis
MHADDPEGALASLIFPLFNPGEQLRQTWQRVEEFLRTARGRWEILFVCDGCSDGSPDRLAEWSRRQFGRVRVLSYPRNRGKGYAVRRGLLAAAGRWRVFTDIDLAYGFDDIERVAATLRNGAEVAIASRTHPESQILLAAPAQGYVYRRHLQSLIFSQMVRLLLPVEQQDTQAGLKGLSARAAECVLPYLCCDGFEFDCELLTACRHFGLGVREVPVCVRYDGGVSTTNVTSSLRMLRALWKVRRRWRTAPPAGPVMSPDYLEMIEAGVGPRPVAVGDKKIA